MTERKVFRFMASACEWDNYKGVTGGYIDGKLDSTIVSFDELSYPVSGSILGVALNSRSDRVSSQSSPAPAEGSSRLLEKPLGRFFAFYFRNLLDISLVHGV